MDKKTIIAIVLTLAILLIYNGFIGQQSTEHTARFLSDSTDETIPEEKKNVLEKSIALDLALEETETREQRATKKLQLIESDEVAIKLSNIGGVVESVAYKQYEYVFPLTDILAIEEYETKAFQLKSASSQQVIYTYEDSKILIEKTFRLSDSHSLSLLINVQNKTESAIPLSIRFQSFTIDAIGLEQKVENSRDKSLYEYQIALPEKIVRAGSAYKFSSKMEKQEAGNVQWLGFRDRYFCAITKPYFSVQKYFVDYIDNNRLSLGMISATESVLPGGKREFEVFAFFGPQSTGLLKEYGEGFENIVAFSNFGLLNAISKGIIRFIKLIHGVIPSWGACIVIVSILIYFALYPLTMKGMLSMKRMQSLQPQIAKIREQHKNNPQRLNKEMMGLYKEHKINPLGGCLPLLLQMPIFIALYHALWRSIIFKGADFLWIKDLSEPDRLIHPLPFQLPFIGNEFNILPVLMMIIMMFQQRLTAKNMQTTDPTQKAQQKMMGLFFPVLLGVIFYKFASGLTIYFTIFYLLSTFTQWKMSKMTVLPAA